MSGGGGGAISRAKGHIIRNEVLSVPLGRAINVLPSGVSLPFSQGFPTALAAPEFVSKVFSSVPLGSNVVIWSPLGLNLNEPTASSFASSIDFSPVLRLQTPMAVLVCPA